MEPMHSTFNRLPVQLEWCFAFLIGYAAYIFSLSTGLAALACITAGLVIINGWISARASSELYHDSLFVTDCFQLTFYFLLLRGLHQSPDTVQAKLYAYSTCILLFYALWDILILAYVKNEERRRRYALYIALLFISSVVHALCGVLTYYAVVDDRWCVVTFVLSWGGLLGLWHYHKFMTTRSISREERLAINRGE
jgi:hypothetical protein